MIFFTRELHGGFQDESGWTRSASEKYTRNYKLYKKYFRLIRPFLSSSAIRFSQFGFHDSEVVARDWKDQKLHLILDTAGVLYPLPRRYAHVTFTGVRSPCPAATYQRMVALWLNFIWAAAPGSASTSCSPKRM
jgi:hypothetical protein